MRAGRLAQSAWGLCARLLEARIPGPCASLVGLSQQFLRALNGSVGEDPNCKRMGTQE